MVQLIKRVSHSSLLACATWLVAFAASILAPIGAANGATWYVSTTGTNSFATPGTQRAPWKSVSYAATRVAAAGDTIHINAGTFSEDNPIDLKVGVNLEGSGSTTVLKPSATFPTTSTLINMSSATMTNGNQTVSQFTIDGNAHQLNVGIDALKRNNLAFRNLTIQNCKFRAIHVEGNIPTNASWPSNIGEAATLPNDADYASNIQISDSTFRNSGLTDIIPNTNPPQYYPWSYGSIDFYGIRNSSIYRVTVDETSYGGFGIQGRWGKNVSVYRNTFRMKASSPNGNKAFSIEMWWTTNGNIFDNDANGGFSIAPNNNVHIHHNRIAQPATEAKSEGIEFGGVASRADHNYIESGKPGIAFNGPDTDNVRIDHNVISQSKNGILLSAYTDEVGRIWGMTNINIDNNTFDGCWSIYNGGTLNVRNQNIGPKLTGVKLRNNVVINSKKDDQPANPDDLSLQGDGATIGGANGGPIIAGQIISGISVASNMFFNNVGGTNDGDCALAGVLPGPPALCNRAGGAVTGTNNRTNTNPLFKATGAKPSPYYELQATSSARSAGIAVGLPLFGSAPDIGAFVQPVGSRVETEMNYSVDADVGTNSIVTAGYNLASSGQAANLFDTGDSIRVHFTVSTTKTKVLVRLRSGDDSSSSYYFNGNYEFRLDGQLVAFVGDLTSISARDPSGGGVYWGTMTLSGQSIAPGLHSLQISAKAPWNMVDYLELQ
jgi:hypothetical protein